MSPSRPSPLSRLPTPLAHFLGHRSSPPPPERSYIIYIWSFIGSFAGLSILQALFGQASYFIERKVPPVLASYGASAVLCYGAIEAPLAQPRALVIGHTISATSAISIVKLFALLGSTRYESLKWLAGSLSTAVAIVLMQMTKTTHPPAGATALLAALDPDRRFPVFWVEPAVPAEAEPEEASRGRDGEGGEKGAGRTQGSRASSLTLGQVRHGEGGEV
ncbi:MAG: hypothetical protein Q9186_002005 [Xanthomendoza sp. 1 TL-2023]